MMWVNTPPAKQDDRLSRGQLHMIICYHCHWQHEDTHSHNVSITRGHTTKLALELRVKALRLCPSERSHCLTFLSSKMTGGRVKTVDYDNNTRNYIFTCNLYFTVFKSCYDLQHVNVVRSSYKNTCLPQICPSTDLIQRIHPFQYAESGFVLGLGQTLAR